MKERKWSEENQEGKKYIEEKRSERKVKGRKSRRKNEGKLMWEEAKIRGRKMRERRMGKIRRERRIYWERKSGNEKETKKTLRGKKVKGERG